MDCSAQLVCSCVLYLHMAGVENRQSPHYKEDVFMRLLLLLLFFISLASPP
eukprot:m.9284 g.9284  ORF g.9284 m.9284 type:complete len:51 (+) comp5690_c0_seq1:280-432(+)